MPFCPKDGKDLSAHKPTKGQAKKKTLIPFAKIKTSALQRHCLENEKKRHKQEENI